MVRPDKRLDLKCPERGQQVEPWYDADADADAEGANGSL